VRWPTTLAALVLAGCASRLPPPAPAPSAREGRTSVRVLESSSRPEPPPDAVVERITPAFASDQNELPEFPDYALKAGCQHGVVPVRLYVGADGNVAGVHPIPGRPVVDDQCHSALWAATCGAVQKWRFSPALRQTPRPGPDLDGDGRPDFPLWEQRPIMIYLDFEFTFDVVEGRGVVQAR
jgi:hypothetical protein